MCPIKITRALNFSGTGVDFIRKIIKWGKFLGNFTVLTVFGTFVNNEDYRSFIIT